MREVKRPPQDCNEADEEITMNTLLFWLVTTAGAVAGLMQDPFSWALVAAAALLGYSRRSWLGWLALALVATGLYAVPVYHWRTQAGLATHWPSFLAWQGWLKLVATAPFFAVGRAIGRLISRR